MSVLGVCPGDKMTYFMCFGSLTVPEKPGKILSDQNQTIMANQSFGQYKTILSCIQALHVSERCAEPRALHLP